MIAPATREPSTPVRSNELPTRVPSYHTPILRPLVTNTSTAWLSVEMPTFTVSVLPMYMPLALAAGSTGATAAGSAFGARVAARVAPPAAMGPTARLVASVTAVANAVAANHR